MHGPGSEGGPGCQELTHTLGVPSSPLWKCLDKRDFRPGGQNPHFLEYGELSS
jgi:hypothetical protein